MPRIDDYTNARRLAVESLTKTGWAALQARSGFETFEDGAMMVPFLDRRYRLASDDFKFADLDAAGRQVPIQEQILVLHYLMGADAPAPSGRWVAYREIPGASFYNSAFIKRAVDPMKKTFGQDAAGFRRAAARLGGRSIDAGDAGFEFRAFPKVPLQIILHEGDEEFPAEAGILFDRSAGGILSPEDIAWLAGMVVYRLIALSGG